MLSILALDVSKTATAFAFGRPDQEPVTGLQGFTQTTPDAVWLKASAWISDQLKVFAPDIVAIEAKIASTGNAGMHTNAATQEVLWGLQTIFRTFVLAKLGKPALLIPSSTARKVLTGRGSYPKGEAKDAVIRHRKERQSEEDLPAASPRWARGPDLEPRWHRASALSSPAARDWPIRGQDRLPRRRREGRRDDRGLGAPRNDKQRRCCQLAPGIRRGVPGRRRGDPRR